MVGEAIQQSCPDQAQHHIEEEPAVSSELTDLQQQSQIRHRIVAALDSMPAWGDGPDLRPYLERQLYELSDRVPGDKLSASELAALVVIFITADARLSATDTPSDLGRQAARQWPVLRIVPSGQPAERVEPGS